MVALSSLAGAGWQFFGNNGLPLAGGKLFTYAAGTTTPLATYTSSSGVTPHANPIILDSAGRVPSEVWLTSGSSYKFTLKTSANVEIWTKDNVPGIVTAADLAKYVTTADLASSAAGKGDDLVEQSNGQTVRSNSPIYIWHKLPSLVGGGSAGTATENALRLQAQLDALAAQGGGILQLVEDAIDIDRPLVPAPKVSIIGPGMGRALLRNTYASTYAGCDYRQSPVIRTGNISIGYTGTAGNAANNLWLNSNSKALNAVVAGDMAATLTSSGDAAGYAVGDYVIFFSGTYYTDAGSLQLAQYMVVRKITKISGAILYVDRPFRADFTGSAYNLRTGTMLGAATLASGAGAAPLYAYSDAELAGFDVDTIWHWKGADACCYNAAFSDIDVRRSRTIAYGNMHFYTTFNNVGGRFTQVFSELAQNSEGNVVENFQSSFDLLEQTATGTTSFFAALTLGENSLGNTFRDGVIECTGAPSGGGSFSVIKQNNAQQVTVRNLRMFNYSATYVGNLLDIGNNLTATGRIEAINGDYDIRWFGACRRYVRFANANTNSNIIAGDYRGAVELEAVVIDQVTGRNEIKPTVFMQLGELATSGTTLAFMCHGAYIGGGVRALTTTDYTPITSNDIRGVRTLNSAARRAGTTSRASSYNIATAEADALSAAIGTSTLQRQDEITFSINVSVSGAGGTKTIKFNIVDTTTPTTYAILQFVIAAGTAGVVTIRGMINVMSPSAIYAQATVVDPVGVATPTVVTNTPITTDLSAKAVTLSISAVKVSAGDTATITAARMALTNPVQL